jgi:hypothetical protein
MGGFQPVPIDPLPTVQAPQPGQQGQPAQLPEQQPVSGWMGATKKGQALNIFSNFLQGWMAGKHMQEQKKLDAALKNVGNYETDYKNSMTIYQNLLNSPDATPEQKEKARQDVLTNWHELHQVQKKYLMPDPDAQKKQGVGGKIKSKLKGAVTAQDPHLFAASAIDLADKMDPTQSVSKDPRTEAANLELAEAKKKQQKENEYSDLLKKTTRTADEQKRLESLEDEMYGPGTADKSKVASIQRKELEQTQTDLEAARQKYKTSGAGALNERERTLMQNAGDLPKVDIKTPFEGYAAEVGPGKKFATYAEAADAYYKKEVDVARASRQPSMWAEMTEAGKAVLSEQYAKEDADPSKPHTYRITIGGKTEERQLTDEQVKAAQAQDKNLKATKIPRVPTKGDVYGWVAERMKASPEEKEDAKHQKPPTPAQMATAMSPIYATVIQDNPDWERFVAKQKGPGGGVTMALNPFKESDVKWYERTSTQKKNYEDFLKAVQNEMIRRGMGQYVNQVLPLDEPVTPQEMSPPPQ